MAAIVLLRQRSGVGIAVSWVLVAETVTDTFLNVRRGMEEHLIGTPLRSLG